MRGLLKTATTTFDWVVIDSAPVLPLADARFLATLCDAAIMVAREGIRAGRNCRKVLRH